MKDIVSDSTLADIFFDFLADWIGPEAPVLPPGAMPQLDGVDIPDVIAAKFEAVGVAGWQSSLMATLLAIMEIIRAWDGYRRPFVIT